MLSGISAEGADQGGAEAGPRAGTAARAGGRSAGAPSVGLQGSGAGARRELVAQMTRPCRAHDLRRGCVKVTAPARVAWVELLADADVEPASSTPSSSASGAVRDRIAADDRPAGGRPRAPGTGSRAGRARGGVRARRGDAWRRHPRSAGGRPRDVGGPAADARELGGGTRASLHRGLPCGGEAPRAAAARRGRSAERLPRCCPRWRPWRRPRTTPRCAASGSRSASSGRRLPASWRSIPR